MLGDGNFLQRGVFNMCSKIGIFYHVLVSVDY